MTRLRLCFCGCGADISGKRKGAIWASESCRKAFLRGDAPANASKSRPSGPSGAQVSYFKAVREVADTLGLLGLGADEARHVARETVRRALPERQRERLNGGTA